MPRSPGLQMGGCGSLQRTTASAELGRGGGIDVGSRCSQRHEKSRRNVHVKSSRCSGLWRRVKLMLRSEHGRKLLRRMLGSAQFEFGPSRARRGGCRDRRVEKQRPSYIL